MVKALVFHACFFFAVFSYVSYCPPILRSSSQEVSGDHSALLERLSALRALQEQLSESDALYQEVLAKCRWLEAEREVRVLTCCLSKRLMTGMALKAADDV